MKNSESKSKLSNYPNSLIWIKLIMIHGKLDMEDLANMPKPSRIISCVEPNLGKSNIIKMMLIHAEPPFERIVIYHSDPSSKEYNDIDAEYIDYIPEVDFWDEDIKHLFILEDINFQRLNEIKKILLIDITDVSVHNIIYLYGQHFNVHFHVLQK